MSQSAILNIKNINLFTNENPEIQFSLSRDEKVTAQYSAYDKEKGYDLRGVRAKSKAGKGYIRMVLSLTGDEGSKRQYFQAALFKNDKKDTDKAPDFRGSVQFSENQDDKLALAAWIKTGDKAGKYMSIAISEFRSDSASARAPVKNQSPAGDPFDMDDDAPAAPAARTAPARPAAVAAPSRSAARPDGYQSQSRPTPAPARTQARPAPAPAPAQAPANDWDDMDDIPF